MGDLFKMLAESRWGLTLLGAAGTLAVGSGVVEAGSTEGTAFGVASIGCALLGVAALVARIKKAGKAEEPKA